MVFPPYLSSTPVHTCTPAIYSIGRPHSALYYTSIFRCQLSSYPNNEVRSGYVLPLRTLNFTRVAHEPLTHPLNFPSRPLLSAPMSPFESIAKCPQELTPRRAHDVLFEVPESSPRTRSKPRQHTRVRTPPIILSMANERFRQHSMATSMMVQF
jgi:hypothetical protein